MWVKVGRVGDERIIGTVANIPLFSDSPSFGERVEVHLSEVEDIIRKNPRKPVGSVTCVG